MARIWLSICAVWFALGYLIKGDADFDEALRKLMNHIVIDTNWLDGGVKFDNGYSICWGLFADSMWLEFKSEFGERKILFAEQNPSFQVACQVYKFARINQKRLKEERRIEKLERDKRMVKNLVE